VSTGSLVVVGTPIGNLGDLTPRAVEELAAADVIACEDTRRTGKLLEHAGIRARAMLVINDHSEVRQIRHVLDRLSRGERVAIVTDAGMPGISDPGERLVRAAAEAGHAVEVIPGPSAAIAALVASGLPTGRFVFEGFLPRRGSARTRRLEELGAERRTVVLFESPHRLVRTLGDLVEAFGADRAVSVARELTKLHEQVWRGTLAGAVEHSEAQSPRGEYVIVVAGAPEPGEPDDDAIERALAESIERGATVRDAVSEVSLRLGVGRRRVYDLAVRGGSDAQ
jgi:16S rRNA (cytidine1402-2'-O)-methyltransferase